MFIPRKLPNGSQAWLDPEVDDFVRRLAEIDPRLALVKHADQSWSIFRVAEDGSEHHIARSKPNARLDGAVLARLQAGSLVARGNQPVERMIAHNEKLRADYEQQTYEAEQEMRDILLTKAWRGRTPGFMSTSGYKGR